MKPGPDTCAKCDHRISSHYVTYGGQGAGGCFECDCAGIHAPTVKRVDLFGTVTDTHATEGEMNGFRLTQGRML